MDHFERRPFVLWDRFSILPHISLGIGRWPGRLDSNDREMHNTDYYSGEARGLVKSEAKYSFFEIKKNQTWRPIFLSKNHDLFIALATGKRTEKHATNCTPFSKIHWHYEWRYGLSVYLISSFLQALSVATKVVFQGR